MALTTSRDLRECQNSCGTLGCLSNTCASSDLLLTTTCINCENPKTPNSEKLILEDELWDMVARFPTHYEWTDDMWIGGILRKVSSECLATLSRNFRLGPLQDRLRFGM
jgi:hypothetical protein